MKIKPVYFPFSEIEDPVLSAIRAAFGPPLLLLPSALTRSKRIQELEEKGLILTFTFGEDEEAFLNLLSEYKRLGDLHGGDPGFLTGMAHILAENPPFFSEDATHRIRSLIKGTGGRKKEPPEGLLSNRIFLHLAAEHDRSIREIEDEISALKPFERTLSQEIGEYDVKSGLGDTRKEDQGQYMTQRRIKAWTELFFNAFESMEAFIPIFVTESPAVFETVTGDADGGEMIRIKIPSGIGHQPLVGTMDDLYDILKGETAPEDGAAEGIKILLFKAGGIPPETLLLGKKSFDNTGSIRDTLIARIEVF